MPIISRRRDVAVGAEGWPVTAGLWALYLADNPNNTLTGDPSNQITQMWDESGNTRHATGNETWEPTGLSTSKPCLNATGTRLQIDGGSNLTTSKVSVFWVGQCSSSTLQIGISGNLNSAISLSWTVDGNSPFVSNNAGGTIVQGVSPLTYFTDYTDSVARSVAFLYDDTPNVRTMYVSGVKTNEDGDTGWSGTPAGAFVFKNVMGGNEAPTNRLAALAIYEAKILSASEITELHNYVKNTLGLVA